MVLEEKRIQINKQHYHRLTKTREIDGVIYKTTGNGLFISEEGRAYRFRRGKLVEIPLGWVGKTVDRQTIAKRQSKKGRGKSFRKKVQR